MIITRPINRIQTYQPFQISQETRVFEKLNLQYFQPRRLTRMIITYESLHDNTAIPSTSVMRP